MIERRNKYEFYRNRGTKTVLPQLRFRPCRGRGEALGDPCQRAPCAFGVKENPNSRRHIISAWTVAQVDNMALPPCHSMFQFYVANNRLSCQLYQRSADVFLGVPFNIASYALFTMMIAKVCGYELGDFVHTFGDTHIYLNHFEQVQTQLSREPRPLPRMIIHGDQKDIFSFKYEDFELVDYDPHPHIKGVVAV